jgi:hypothetical protein
MPIDERDPTLSAPFSALVRTELSAATLATWDPGLARDPRLLVPVDLQALVVPAEATLPRADVATRLFDPDADTGPNGMPVRRMPAPFTEADDRPPGVYLHWAMPDGLTQGRAERAGGSAGGMGHRPLPNRWLVVRAEQGRPRSFRAWVLESERGVSQPLEGWSERPPEPEEPPEPGLDPSHLTAVVGGDLAWAAVFDNVVGRFGFHDDLEGLASPDSRLTYLVVGWYSRSDLDPLHLGDTPQTFEQLLTELGWAVDPADLARARREAQRTVDTVRRVGVASRDPMPAGPEASLEEIPERETPREGRRVGLPSVPYDLIRGARDMVLEPLPWWPRQSVYHGTIYGVDTRGDQERDPRPGPGDVTLGVGPTDVESLAAMIAAGTEGGSLGERLQTAFGYGLLDTFEQPDGIPRLDEEVHRRGFVSQSGGTPREERIRAGDPFADITPGRALLEPLPAAAGRGLFEEGTILAGVGPRGFELGARAADSLVEDYIRRTRPDRLDPAPPEPVHIETVYRAQPRFYYPTEPVLTVRGSRRSLRHGYDGRFEPDERVACRISGDPIGRYAGLVDGRDLLQDGGLQHGGIPPEAEALLAESVLNDPFAVDDMAAEAADRTGLDPDELRARLEAETRLFVRTQAPEADAVRLLAASLRDGVLPSPLAVTVWRQPWVPLYLEWELELAVDGDLGRWTLGEIDLEPALGAEVAAEAETTVQGRSLLGPSGAQALAAGVVRFLEEENRLDLAGRGHVTEANEGVLRSMAKEAGYSDLLSGALEGVREHLLGFDDDMSIVPDGEELPPIAPARAPVLLAGGLATLTRVRLVDAFGRTVELGAPDLDRTVIADSLRPSPEATTEGTALLLPPRLISPSRLLLRLLDGSGVDVEATIDQSEAANPHSPLAGWLLPDHADAALEIFDPEGSPLGQLRHDAVTGGVLWEGAPGHPGPVGAAPGELISNPHTRAFAEALVERDAADRAVGIGRSESPLSALLRVIDTTLWTVDPFAQGGTEHLSLLVGRPVAMVRATLRLEVLDDTESYPTLDEEVREARRAAYRALMASALEVRLGALTRTDDGLLGYFVDDDYRRFYPVHARVLSEALPSGPHAGYLGPADTTADFNENLDENREPIEQAYVEPDPTVTVRPGQTVRLTLLMDPSAKVHVTSGVLPRKDVSLLRDWIADPLGRLIPSLRTGPVLLDPRATRLPRPTHLPTDQLWTRRTDPVTWRDDPIAAATQEALLPDTPAAFQEGYIRADLGQGETDEPVP